MTKAVKIPVTVKMRAGWNDALAQRRGTRPGWSGRRGAPP
jgi:tRNA-dihydrouridine synthase